MFKCSYCGIEILTEKAYWGHVEICPENPKNKPKEVKEEVVKKDDTKRGNRKSQT